MGMYDTYGNCQLKIGECIGFNYEVGDKVDIADGIYLCNEGAIVIKDGIFVAEFNELISKWGHKIEIEPIVSELNPITQAMRAQEKKEMELYLEIISGIMKKDPQYELKVEFGKLLLRHIDSFTPEERGRYDELKSILTKDGNH